MKRLIGLVLSIVLLSTTAPVTPPNKTTPTNVIPPMAGNVDKLRSERVNGLLSSIHYSLFAAFALAPKSEMKNTGGPVRDSLLKVVLNDLGEAEKVQHFPKHIREEVKEILRGKTKELGITEQDIDAIVDAKDLSQWSRRWIKIASPEIIKAVTAALREVVAKEYKITPEKVDALLNIHAKIHLILHENPEIVINVLTALKSANGYEGFSGHTLPLETNEKHVRELLKNTKEGKRFSLIRNAYEANYLPCGSDEEYVEELIVNYFLNILIFNNNEIFWFPKKPLTQKKSKSSLGHIKVGMDMSYQRSITEGTREISPLIRLSIYNSPLRHDFSGKIEPNLEPGVLAFKNFNFLQNSETEFKAILGAPDPISKLLRIANDKKMEQVDRAKAVSLLGQIGTPKVLKILTKILLNSDSVCCRAQAAKELGLFGSAKEWPALIKAMGDTEEFVSDVAVFALARQDHPAAIDPLIGKIKRGLNWNEKIKQYLSRYDKALVTDKLIKKIRTLGIVEYKVELIDLLSDIGDPTAFDTLAFLLRNSIDDCKIRAAAGLGRLGLKKAEDELITALEDTDPAVRLEAARSLGKTGSIKSQDPLLKLLGDKYDDVRLVSMEVLGKIGDRKAVKHLNLLLENADEIIKENATAAIAEISLREIDDMRAAREQKIKAAELAEASL